MSEREEMIRVRQAYSIVGALPLDDFPRAAAVLRKAIQILDSAYPEVWGGAKLGLSTRVLDAFAVEPIDYTIIDRAIIVVSMLPREDVDDLRVIMEHVLEYFISDVQKHWNRVGRGPIRELLRLIDGGAA